MATPNALTNLIQLASNVANAYTIALYAADREEGTLTLREQLTLSSHFNSDGMFSIGEGILGEVALTREPRMEDFSGESKIELEWYTAHEEIKGMLVVPVVRRDLEGVLVVDSKESYSFTPKLQKLVIGFAEQMAWYLSLEKKNPTWIDGEPADFQQMLKWCRFLTDAPHRKALCERFMHIPRALIQCDATAVVWFDNDGRGRITHSKGWKHGLKTLTVESGIGICGACLDSGQPQLVPNTLQKNWILFSEEEAPEEFGSFMVAPIANEKRMQGMVLCASRSPRALKKKDLDKLTLMTAFVASSLDKIESKLDSSDFILKPNQKTFETSKNFLPIHITAFEEEIIKRNSPVSVVSLRASNANDLLPEDKAEQLDSLFDQVSTYLANEIDHLKLFIRYPDEGLVLLLIGVGEEEALLLEESLLNLLSEASFTLGGIPWEGEFDFGLSSFPADSEDLKQLIEISWSRALLPGEKTHG